MYKLTELKKKSLNAEVQYTYSRSSGPGGQKVNKTETRVELFWDLPGSQLFTAVQKQRLTNKLKNRLNSQGQLHFYSDQFRTRPQNQKACFQQFVEAIETALTRPKPRKKTKPKRSAIEKRIKEKKRQGDKKKLRQKVD
jgi:ribosome-associated protein